MPTTIVDRIVSRPWPYERRLTYCNGTSSTSSSNWGPNTSCELFYKRKEWVRTPNFQALRRLKANLPDNNYSVEFHWAGDETLVATQRFIYPCSAPNGNLAMDERIYSLPAALRGAIEGARYLTEDGCKAKLIDRAKGAEWSAPTFFGEARETVSMVASTARTIASAFRDLRRGNLAGALASLSISGTASQRRRYYRDYGVNPSRAAASHWLALTFGWRPLISDVYNAAETLAEHALDENKRVGRVTATDRKVTTVVTPNHVFMASPTLLCNRTTVVSESVRGVWKFEPTSWNSWGSFGLLNPASVAWELLPFSFVADWFLPVGRYLEGLDVPMRFKHLGGSIGYRKHTQMLYEGFDYGGLPATGTHSTTHVSVSRAKMTESPTLEFSSITFEPKLGTGRVLSSIALMRQVFGR